MTALVAPGATVAVIAPAGRFVAERLDAGMATLQGWGYEIALGRHLRATDHYHAGTPEQRLADLQWALDDPGVHAVWLARGGFGCAQLLPGVRLSTKKAKPIIGFSDATALHTALLRKGWLAAGGALIHGPVVHTLAPCAQEGSADPVLVDAESRRALLHLLHHCEAAQHAGRLLVGPQTVVRGPVVGGNLSVLASLCGTRWQLQARGAIVLLEEVAEAPYRVDRMVTQLLQSGCLAGAVGIGLGDFTACAATDAGGLPYSAAEILAQRLAPLQIPVVTGLAFGHGPRNIAWPVGAMAELGPTGLCWAAPDSAGHRGRQADVRPYQR